MKALNQLHGIQSRKLDKESRELATLETRRVEAQRSLDALGQYRREMSRLPDYNPAFSLHNRSIMHRQLGDLIDKQHDEQVALKLSIVQQKKEVLNAFVARKSSEIMLERLQARQALEAQRREQNILDELALNRARLVTLDGW
ncbi:hypothetical protein M976_01920 [Buttiauxella ferragutiae ATCC 51602]|jgi:flagellar export protein FliJ|uniref:Flagellar FliJ protein n=1 Tax=Buttiauxella ferragutiae ATCC 51602 TaxID=1354252 RepID=A0ABX2W952_9ENTR|nr:MULTISPECIES: flagellar export protein FliJ [Buttiauxella]OAT28081.1 hypothetical protein M976_01920 [Buttiauxella ferragutiae ATCC 51602]TDN49785.1 flagellar export protein FliJ [Buttiauxella sp. JUb87]